MRFGLAVAGIAILISAASAEAQRFDFGPQFAAPIATAGVGQSEVGLSAGGTLTAMQSRVGGFGVDVAYHYWPASTKVKDELDTLLWNTTFQTIDADTWAFSVLQATYHAKIVAPLSERFSPWVQVGAGPHRIDRNLKGYARGRIAWALGGYGSVGVDFPANPHVRLGLNASYHHLWSEKALGAEFGAFEIGAHVLFGV